MFRYSEAEHGSFFRGSDARIRGIRQCTISTAPWREAISIEQRARQALDLVGLAGFEGCLMRRPNNRCPFVSYIILFP